MCHKLKLRVACEKCGYPPSEALHKDADPPLPCDVSVFKLLDHIKEQETNDRTNR